MISRQQPPSHVPSCTHKVERLAEQPVRRRRNVPHITCYKNVTDLFIGCEPRNPLNYTQSGIGQLSGQFWLEVIERLTQLPVGSVNETERHGPP